MLVNLMMGIPWFIGIKYIIITISIGLTFKEANMILKYNINLLKL